MYDTILLLIVQKWQDFCKCCNFEGMCWYVNSSGDKNWVAPRTCLVCLHSVGVVHWKHAHTAEQSQIPFGSCLVTPPQAVSVARYPGASQLGKQIAEVFYTWELQGIAQGLLLEPCHGMLTYVIKLANQTKCKNDGESRLRQSHLGVHVVDHLLRLFWQLLVLELENPMRWMKWRATEGKGSCHQRGHCVFF